MFKKNKWPALLVIFLCSTLLLFFRSTVFSSSKQDDTLLGEDSNKTGIRNDVNEYIQKRFPKSEKKRAALSQLARDWQSAFQVYEDPIRLKSAVLAIEKSQLCANAIFGEEGVDEVHSLMAELFSNNAVSLE